MGKRPPKQPPTPMPEGREPFRDGAGYTNIGRKLSYVLYPGLGGKEEATAIQFEHYMFAGGRNVDDPLDRENELYLYVGNDYQEGHEQYHVFGQKRLTWEEAVELRDFLERYINRADEWGTS